MVNQGCLKLCASGSQHLLCVWLVWSMTPLNDCMLAVLFSLVFFDSPRCLGEAGVISTFP